MLDDRKFIIRPKAEIPKRMSAVMGRPRGALGTALSKMEVGESVVAGDYTKRLASLASVTATKWSRRLPGRKFATRKEGDKITVWRVA